MLNTNPKGPLTRTVAFLVGLSIVGMGLGPILKRGSLFYTNWFGELVFCPFAILFGLAIIWAAVFKSEIFDKPRMTTKRKTVTINPTENDRSPFNLW